MSVVKTSCLTSILLRFYLYKSEDIILFIYFEKTDFFLRAQGVGVCPGDERKIDCELYAWRTLELVLKQGSLLRKPTPDFFLARLLFFNKIK